MAMPATLFLNNFNKYIIRQLQGIFD